MINAYEALISKIVFNFLTSKGCGTDPQTNYKYNPSDDQ